MNPYMVAISVVMSVYNEPVDWIRQSIDSILNQTFRDFEFIIINDNPEGISQKKLLKEFAAKDNRIKIIENEENKGLATSLNKGIKIASGNYIVRMDADDISMPNRFQVQFDYMESHPDIDICGTWAKFFGKCHKIKSRKYKMPTTPEASIIHSLFASPLIHPSIIARTTLMQNYIYDPSLRKAQDFDLWSRIICGGHKIASLPMYLLKYRITNKSLDISVVSSQEKVSHLCRNRVIKYLGLKINQEDYDHSEMCRINPNIDITTIENGLKYIKDFLLDKYPNEHKYITSIIGNYWSINCNIQKISLNYYRNSYLYWGFKWIDVMRLIKNLPLKLIHSSNDFSV